MPPSRVTFRFWGSSLLEGSGRDVSDYDLPASIRAYTEAVRDALHLAFPGATVSVRSLESGVVSVPHTVLASVDGLTGTPAAKRVMAVAGEVFRSMTWLVKKGPTQ